MITTAREVIVVHYFSGMPHKDIAAVLGVSPQTVRGGLGDRVASHG